MEVEEQEGEEEQMMLVRHGSDASASTTFTSNTIDSNDSTNSNDDNNNNDDDDDERSLVVTLIGSIANLCSATLGAGILALPFAFYQAGLICGTILLLASAWATSTSIGLLVESCDKYKLSTYERIVERGLGYKFRSIVEVSILIFCCGTAVGYVIAVGDIIERVIPFMTPGQLRIAKSLVWLIAMLPLSCLRRMKSLECASSVGIISIITLLVAATVHLIHHDDEDDDDDEESRHNNSEESSSPWSSLLSVIGPANGSWISVLQACPIFFYAFSCQVNVAQIFEELPASVRGRNTAADDDSDGGKGGKIKKMNWVTISGVLVCGLLYASVSLVTLLDFGNGVKPNILSCYKLKNDGSDPLLHIAFLAMALAVVTAFPLNIFPARVSLILMWEKNQKKIINIDQQQQIICCGIGGGIEEQVKQSLLPTNRNNNGSDYNSVGREDHDPLRPPSTTITQQQHQNNLSDGNGGGGDGGVITHGNYHDENDDGRQEGENDNEEFHPLQHSIVTLILAGTALGFALVVPNISIVFGLLGGTTSSLLGFIVPGLLGLQLDRSRTSAWFLVICGSIIAVLTTTVTVYSMF